MSATIERSSWMNSYLVSQLKAGRLSKGLKQSDVAKKIGVKGNTLSNYENGVSEPDIDTFCALCDIYEIDPAELLGEAYGLNVQGTGFEIKPSEINIIKIYRSLDNQGKKVIDFLLESELNRYREIQEMQQQIIANNEEINFYKKFQFKTKNKDD